MTRDRERGSALVVVMLILSALLAGAAIVLSVQRGDVHSVGLVREARDSLYCAEAGLAAARARIGDHLADVGALLDGDSGNDPEWYPLVADVGDGGDPDYEVTVRDNDDEVAPLADDPTTDRDLQIFIVSRCVRHDEVTREVLELVSFQGGGHAYRDQAGQGSGNTGNAN